MDARLVDRIYAELEKIPIYDPHTHIDFRGPVARTLADILGYHYYTELCNAADYEPGWLPVEGPPEAIVEAVVPRLRWIVNTHQYGWLMGIGERFLGIDPRDWEARPPREIFEKAARRMAAPGYCEEVLEATRVERIYLTNAFDEDLEGLDTNLFVPCLRGDDFVFHIEDPQVRRRIEAVAGGHLRTLAEFRAVLRGVFERFAAKGMAYPAISSPPRLELRPVADNEAEALFSQVLGAGTISGPDRDSWISYAIFELARLAREHGKPFHLMIGVDRRVYDHGVPGGQDLLDSWNSLRGYDALFNAFPDVAFPVSVLADTQGLELVAAGWIRHNVYPSGHWWYVNHPSDIARELRRRLDVVPWRKLIGYYSDAYTVEFIEPKFRMFKYELARVLAERIDLSRRHPTLPEWTVDRALEIGHAMLVDNPRRIFGDSA